MNSQVLVGRSLAIGLALWTSASMAHGKEQHLLGTVRQVGTGSITVETTQKKQLEVQIDDRTRFEKNGAKITANDVKAGERVAIHALPKDGKLTATTVKIGAAGSQKPGPAHAPEHAQDGKPKTGPK